MQLLKNTLVICLCSWVLIACSSQEDKLARELNTYHDTVHNRLTQLKQHIGAGRLRNAKLLESYAGVVRKARPEMKEIVDTLALDATHKGPLYQSLVSRLSDAKSRIPQSSKAGMEASRQLVAEFNRLNTAASVNNFNMMLTDPINVLAGMSDGKLARVTELADDAVQAEASQVIKGSELVGNPVYGQWQTNSSGTTFWEFYGQYAFFSTLFDRPVSYSHWSTHRRPSYYHDVGRDYYSSPSQKARYQQTEQRVKKQFAQQGKAFQSPYAKKASVTKKATAPVSQPKKVLASPPQKFNSAYAKNISHKKTPAQKTNLASKPVKASTTYTSRSNGFKSGSFRSGGK